MALSFMQWTGLMTSNGRLQCPGCGRFRKEADFPDQDEAIHVAGAVVDVVPECRWCREEKTRKPAKGA